MRGEVAQTIYTHVSKCKNDKIKEINLKNTVLALKELTIADGCILGGGVINRQINYMQ
jgi:hypothetical protein